MSTSVGNRPVASPKQRSRCAGRSYFVRFSAESSSRKACRRQRNWRADIPSSGSIPARTR